MPLPGFGTSLSLGNIRTELGVSNTPFSLNSAEAGAYAAINQASLSRPNGATPNFVSEWYNYNHTAASGPSNTRVIAVNSTNRAFMLTDRNLPPWPTTLTEFTSFSVSFWLHPLQNILNPGYAFHIRNFNSTSFFDNNIAVRWSNFLGMTFFMSGQGSGTTHTHTISSDVRLNQWTHYVITYNANTGQIISYRNGAFANATILSGVNFTSITSRNVAALGLAGAAFNNNDTTGKLDELAFYNRVLPSVQVQAIYNNRNAYNHNQLVGLLDWWRFEQYNFRIPSEVNATHQMVGYNWNLPVNNEAITMPF